MPDYALCGLTLHVNHSLPDVLPLVGVNRSDSLKFSEPEIDLFLGGMPEGFDRSQITAELRVPWYASQDQDLQGQPCIVIYKIFGGSYFWLRYADGTEFLIDRLGTKVWTIWPEQFAVDYVLTYILGVILGIILHLRGITCLHGSAIAIQGRAILLLGDSGAGKSTTAAAMSQRGFAILSDDLVPLREYQGQFWVQPTYPQVRLWSDSVAALYGTSHHLPQLTDGWEKRCLDLRSNGSQFQHDPLPLGGVYLMGERCSNADSPLISVVNRSQGLLALMLNRYTSNLPDKPMQTHCFEFLSQVVRQIPIRQITPRSSLDALPQLCDLLVADLQAGRSRM